MQRIIWCCKQLLPLTYRSKYRTSDGAKHFSVWVMWFGRVFKHDHMLIK